MVDACPEGLLDIGGCGLGAALPLEITLDDGNGTLEEQVWPAVVTPLGDFEFRQYVGWLDLGRGRLVETRVAGVGA